MGKGVKATRKAGIIADMEALMGMKKYEDLTQRNREAEMKDFDDKPSGYEIRQVWVSARASIG